MRVLLDCDGVLADFVASVLKFVNLGKPASDQFTHKHVTNWDIFKALEHEHLQDSFDRHASCTGFCNSLAVIPGAVDFVERLHELAEVVVVTAPYEAAHLWCHERLQWLGKHFGISKHFVVFAKNKSFVDGDVLIDDALHNALNFPGVVFLIDQPWNQAESLPENVTRCFGFDAVLDELKFYAHAGATRADMLKDCGPFALPKGP